MHSKIKKRVVHPWSSLAIVCLAAIGWAGLLFAQPPRQRGLRADDPAAKAAFSTGPYYALVIGNNEYKYLPHLQTAVRDATEVAHLLQERYGFKQPKLLLNASRTDILTALNVYRRTLPKNSNLLIYYAGHGNKDPGTKKAYWLPVDAQTDSDVNWISSSTITEEISALPSPHVLLISDSCYSGALRGASFSIQPSGHDEYIRSMLSSPSRTLMSSGRDEPVADEGSAGHSKFAYVLIQSLLRMDQDRFTAGDLFQKYIQPWVAGTPVGPEQVPQYSMITSSGHEYGDFVFSRVHGSQSDTVIADEIIPAHETKVASNDDLRFPVLHPTNSVPDPIVAALHHYEDAYESMDINELKEIWPSLSGKQIDLLKQGFRGAQAVKVQLQQCGQANTAGDTAQVKCVQSMAYTREGRRQPAQTNPVEISLRKAAAGGWLVADVRVP